MSVTAKQLPEAREDVDFPYERVRRISVPQYHRMIDSGVLTEDDPIELLEGWLVTKMPRDPLHDGCLLKLQNALFRSLPDEWLVRVQSAVTTKDSEPEPDLAVVSGPEEKYFEHHPRTSEVALIVEIANSSLEDDRLVKGRIYARAGFPVYWIVDLASRRIEEYTDPRRGKTPAYQVKTVHSATDRVNVNLFGEKVGAIRVGQIFPA